MNQPRREGNINAIRRIARDPESRKNIKLPRGRRNTSKLTTEDQRSGNEDLSQNTKHSRYKKTLLSKPKRGKGRPPGSKNKIKYYKDKTWSTHSFVGCKGTNPKIIDSTNKSKCLIVTSTDEPGIYQTNTKRARGRPSLSKCLLNESEAVTNKNDGDVKYSDSTDANKIKVCLNKVKGSAVTPKTRLSEREECIIEHFSTKCESGQDCGFLDGIEDTRSAPNNTAKSKGKRGRPKRVVNSTGTFSDICSKKKTPPENCGQTPVYFAAVGQEVCIDGHKRSRGRPKLSKKLIDIPDTISITNVREFSSFVKCGEEDTEMQHKVYQHTISDKRENNDHTKKLLYQLEDETNSKRGLSTNEGKQEDNCTSISAKRKGKRGRPKRVIKSCNTSRNISENKWKSSNNYARLEGANGEHKRSRGRPKLSQSVIDMPEIISRGCDKEERNSKISPHTGVTSNVINFEDFTSSLKSVDEQFEMERKVCQQAFSAKCGKEECPNKLLYQLEDESNQKRTLSTNDGNHEKKCISIPVKSKRQRGRPKRFIKSPATFSDISENKRNLSNNCDDTLNYSAEAGLEVDNCIIKRSGGTSEQLRVCIVLPVTISRAYANEENMSEISSSEDSCKHLINIRKFSTAIKSGGEQFEMEHKGFRGTCENEKHPRNQLEDETDQKLSKNVRTQEENCTSSSGKRKDQRGNPKIAKKFDNTNSDISENKRNRDGKLEVIAASGLERTNSLPKRSGSVPKLSKTLTDMTEAISRESDSEETNSEISDKEGISINVINVGQFSAAVEFGEGQSEMEHQLCHEDLNDRCENEKRTSLFQLEETMYETNQIQLMREDEMTFVEEEDNEKNCYNMPRARPPLPTVLNITSNEELKNMHRQDDLNGDNIQKEKKIQEKEILKKEKYTEDGEEKSLVDEWRKTTNNMSSPWKSNTENIWRDIAVERGSTGRIKHTYPPKGKEKLKEDETKGNSCTVQ